MANKQYAENQKLNIMSNETSTEKKVLSIIFELYAYGFKNDRKNIFHLTLD